MNLILAYKSKGLTTDKALASLFQINFSILESNNRNSAFPILNTKRLEKKACQQKICSFTMDISIAPTAAHELCHLIKTFNY